MKFRLLLPFFLFFTQSLFAFDLFQSCFGVPPEVSVASSFVLCPEEMAYVESRLLHVQKGYERLLGGLEEIERVPRLSVCLSGGGYRAMIGSLGFLQGLEAIGVFDVALYISAISGGAMCLANMFMRMYRQGVGLSRFAEILKKRAALPLFDPGAYDTKPLFKKIREVIGERFAFEPLDLWGVMLGDRLFGDLSDPHDILFEDMRALLKRGDASVPFPLFELIVSDVFPYELVHVSPFTVSSDYLGGSVPTAFFDSPFEGGLCSGLRRERSLEWFMALFGSAYNVSIGDALIQLTRMLYDSWSAEQLLIGAFTHITDALNLHEHRVLSSPIYNFMWKRSGAPFSDRKQIELSDAGMACNLPIASVLGKTRSSDILLVFDASSDAGVEEYSELRYAAEYAARKGIAFPAIEKPKVLDSHLLLFEDEGRSEAPVILYFANPIASPVIGVYEADLFEKVRSAAEQVVSKNKEAIIDLIRRRSARLLAV